MWAVPGPFRSWRVLAILALVALALLLGVLVGHDDPLTRADARIVEEVAGWRPGWVVDLARALTTLGSGWVATPALVGAGILLVLDDRVPWRVALLPLVALLVAVALVPLLKDLVDRPRPPLALHAIDEGSSAFPSGHALQSAAGWLTLGLVLARVRADRRWLAATALLVVAIGITRVVLAVHSPSDVLAGWALGTALALALAGGRGTLVSPGGGRPRGRAPRPPSPAAPRPPDAAAERR